MFLNIEMGRERNLKNSLKDLLKISSKTGGEARAADAPIRTTEMLLRLVRAAQPISRIDLARRLNVNRSTVTDIVKPLVAAGLIEEKSFGSDGNGGETKTQGRPPVALSFGDDKSLFVGLNLGVRRSQIGLTDLRDRILAETEFDTPAEPQAALEQARRKIEELCRRHDDYDLKRIGVSVPGLTDAAGRRLIYAPNLGWRDVDVANALQPNKNAQVVVENDATAAAMYEARLKIRNSNDGLLTNFILVRSGTGIGVGLVIGSEVYRGTGAGRGIAGEFGHMTIAAGGKSCVCGNRGCWEKYASAASAASLYTGDRPLRPNETMPRFVEIVAKAENGDLRAQRTLEKIGDYLGIGIANVIMGVGIPRVIVSGRLVYGWRFIETPVKQAIERSIVGTLEGWSIEKGEPAGAAIGGALEVAVEKYLTNGFAV